MNELLDVEDGLKKIKSQLPRLLKVNTNELRLVDVDSTQLFVDADTTSVRINQSAAREYGLFGNISTRMLNALEDRELQARVWENLVLNKPGREITLKVDGTRQVVGISDKANIPDYQMWAERLVDAVNPLGIANLYQRKGKTCFGVVLKEHTTPRSSGGHERINDPIQDGIMITMNGDISAAPYNLRQVCTNGAVAMREGSRFILSEDNWREQLSKVAQLSRKLTQEMAELLDKPLNDAGGLLGGLNRAGVLTAHQVALVAQQLPTLADDATEYDLVQLVTAQQHRVQGLDWLQAGGRVTHRLQEKHCHHCSSLVA